MRFFKETDADGSGRITYEELETAIRKLRIRTEITRYQWPGEVLQHENELN